MMKRRKTIYAVLCLLVGVCMLSGCIEEYEADISTDDTGLLVVEGSICANQRNVFILSRTQGINDFYAPPMVRGAKVSVRGSNGSIFMTEETDGIYSCQIGALSADVEYYLHIEMDGDVYESEPQKPLPTEPIADVRGVQNTPLSDIDVLVTPAAPFEAGRENYYSWTYDETWEVHSDYTTFLFFDVEKMEPVGVDELFPSRGWKDATGQAIMVGASSNYEGSTSGKSRCTTSAMLASACIISIAAWCISVPSRRRSMSMSLHVDRRARRWVACSRRSRRPCLRISAVSRQASV